MLCVELVACVCERERESLCVLHVELLLQLQLFVLPEQKAIDESGETL